MNVYDLSERVAVVTGGAQGIGLAVANRILASGGRVAIWDRDRALLDETVKRIAEGDRVQGLAVDIADLPRSKTPPKRRSESSARSISLSTMRRSSARTRRPGNIRPRPFAMSSMSGCSAPFIAAAQSCRT